MRFGVALQPRDKVGRAPLLQPRKASVIVDLGDGADGVPRNIVGRELDSAPGVDQPAVGIVDGFDATASERRPRQEHGG